VKVLVISVHPDDETLGCGGTLLAHRAEGDEIHWLIVTSGHEDRWSTEAIGEKEREITAVAAAYGTASVSRLDHRAGELETVPVGELMAGIGATVQQAAPEIVYVVHPGDVHTDHSAAFTATMSVLKPFRMRALGVRRVLAFETLSSTDAAAFPSFVPNVYRDITDLLEHKLEVLSLYKSQLQPEPNPRTLSAARALARVRGAAIAVEFAEAFALIREIE
jgi:LmbE family N-acetylglucosaminyl deacetylase